MTASGRNLDGQDVSPLDTVLHAHCGNQFGSELGELHDMATELSVKSRVRINDDVLFQELQGERVLLNLKTGVYMGLDKVGTRVWQLMGQNEMLSGVLEVSPVRTYRTD